jgi:hypothetical protein
MINIGALRWASYQSGSEGRRNPFLMVSRKVQNSGIIIYKILKLILFYMMISLKLGFSPSHLSYPYSSDGIKYLSSFLLVRIKFLIFKEKINYFKILNIN